MLKLQHPLVPISDTLRQIREAPLLWIELVQRHVIRLHHLGNPDIGLPRQTLAAGAATEVAAPFACAALPDGGRGGGWHVPNPPTRAGDSPASLPVYLAGFPPPGVAPLAALRGSYLYAFDTPYSAWDGVNPSDLSWPTRPDSENDVYSR